MRLTRDLIPCHHDSKAQTPSRTDLRRRQTSPQQCFGVPPLAAGRTPAGRANPPVEDARSREEVQPDSRNIMTTRKPDITRAERLFRLGRCTACRRPNDRASRGLRVCTFCTRKRYLHKLNHHTKGLCHQCLRKVKPGYVLCELHLTLRRNYMAKRRAKLRANGYCRRCERKQNPGGGCLACSEHSKKMRNFHIG